MGNNAQDLIGWLGRGIDIFRFDPFGAVTNAKPTRILVASPPQDVIERLPLRSAGYDETYADSLLEISHKLAIEAGLKGSYSDFSGSVDSKFGASTQRTEKRHFLRISFNVSANSYNVS